MLQASRAPLCPPLPSLRRCSAANIPRPGYALRYAPAPVGVAPFESEREGDAGVTSSFQQQALDPDSPGQDLGSLDGQARRRAPPPLPPAQACFERRAGWHSRDEPGLCQLSLPPRDATRCTVHRTCPLNLSHMVWQWTSASRTTMPCAHSLRAAL
jgi:hypothetical protein